MALRSGVIAGTSVLASGSRLYATRPVAWVMSFEICTPFGVYAWPHAGAMSALMAARSRGELAGGRELRDPWSFSWVAALEARETCVVSSGRPRDQRARREWFIGVASAGHVSRRPANCPTPFAAGARSAVRQQRALARRPVVSAIIAD
jgi:hypothetical protein